MPFAHLLLALAVVFVWGTNFVVIKWGLGDLPPFLFATLRFFFSALPWVFFIKRPAVPWRKLMLFGGTMGAGQFGLLFLAMGHDITPGLASLVIQSQVFFTIIVSMALRGERIKPLQACALMLAAFGIGVVALRSAMGAGEAVTTLGVILVLCAGLCWAFMNLMIRGMENVNMLGFMVWSSLFAVPPLVLLSLVVDGPAAILHALPLAGAAGWGAVIWQAMANTLFGYGVWNWLLARHPAATVTPVALLIPVFGMTASAVLLSEPLPLWKLTAAMLVIAGLALNVYASRRSARPYATLESR